MPDGAYQQCIRCVMDTTDPDIVFDKYGICNHCKAYEQSAKMFVVTGEAGQKKLKASFDLIAKEGRGKEYDCLIGLSGGLDSSYLVYLAWKHGLNPLIVLLDNSWDAPETTENVEKILRKTGFIAYQYKFDMDEYYDLQRAYLAAGVVNIEVVFDQAIQPIFFALANKYDLKYILYGSNIASEGVLIPKAWSYPNTDTANLKDIHKKFGKVRLRNYPILNPWKGYYLRFIRGLKYIAPLNWADYNRDEAMKILEEEFDYQYYEHKHFESVFTRFYQALILPCKFGVDKRRPHYSSLIMAGQMTREEALVRIEIPYYSGKMYVYDTQRVLKQLGFTDEEFARILMAKPVPHTVYKTWWVLPRFIRLLRWIRRGLKSVKTMFKR